MTSRLCRLVATLVVAVSSSIAAYAQDTISPSPTSVPSQTVQTTRTPKTHTVNVGEVKISLQHFPRGAKTLTSIQQEEWRFTPRRTDGKVGDTLEFRFVRGDHWVIRGHFDRPCVPYENASQEGDDRIGFNSGERLDDDNVSFSREPSPR